MPQVRYIGTCTKTDSVNGIGLRWEPGQVRKMTSEAAERLLAFSDTWAKEMGKETANVEPVGLSQAEKPIEEPLPVIDFQGMDKEALIGFAERKYNARLDKRQNEDAIRHQVIALFSEHERPE